MILNSFDEHLMLRVRHVHHHPPRTAHARVWHVTVAADLVAAVHDDHAAAHIVSQDTRQLPDGRRLAHAGAAQQQDGLPLGGNVADEFRAARDAAPHACCQAHNEACAVADAADAVESAVHARTVVRAELATRADSLLQLAAREHLRREGRLLAVGEPGKGHAAQVQHQLQQLTALRVVVQSLA